MADTGRMVRPGSAIMPPGGFAPPGYGPQGFAPPKKKSNTGLVVGLIVGGVVLIGAAIGIGVVVAGGKKPVENTTPVVDTLPPKPPEKTAAELAAEALEKDRAKINEFNTWIRTPPNDIRYGEVWNKFKALSALEVRPDLSMDVSIAKGVYYAALGRSATHDFPVELHLEVVEGLLKQETPDATEAARKIAAMACAPNPKDPSKTYKLVVKGPKGEDTENTALVRLAAVADYMVLEEIPQMSDIVNYGWLLPGGFDEVGTYNEALHNTRQTFKNHLVSRAAPEAQALVKAEANLLALINKVDADHAKDGFARWAASAFARFRINYGVKYFDTPRWTYAYAKPFVYFQELQSAEDNQDPESIKRNLESKARVLRQEVEYFEETIRKPFGLKRLYPDVQDEVEKENAPLEIIVLSDQRSFDKAMLKKPEDSRVPPGVRAYYSPLTRQIVTYDEDDIEDDAGKDWWNKSVLIHEAWHFLSAIYIPDRVTLKFTTPEGEEGQYPAYASILIQEGLTDWVAGFEEDKSTGKITFGKTNHLRLKSFKDITRQVTEAWKRRTATIKEGKAQKPDGFVPFEEGKFAGILDLRGLVQVTTYGMTGIGAESNLRKYGLAGNLRLRAFGSQSVLNYIYGCQAVHYLANFENGKYRDKWIQWVKDCYTQTIRKRFDWGEYEAAKYTNSPGLKRFMELFELKDFEDPKWEVMNQEFLKYAMALELKNVGTGEDEPEGGPDEGGDSGGSGDDEGDSETRDGASRWSFPHVPENAKLRDEDENEGAWLPEAA